MTIISDLIDSTYDAVTMMRISAQILSEGDVDDVIAGEISWMLGSCKKRLEPVLDALEIMQQKSEASSELRLIDEIADLERRLRERRDQQETKK